VRTYVLNELQTTGNGPSIPARLGSIGALLVFSRPKKELLFVILILGTLQRAAIEVLKDWVLSFCFWALVCFFPMLIAPPPGSSPWPSIQQEIMIFVSFVNVFLDTEAH